MPRIEMPRRRRLWRRKRRARVLQAGTIASRCFRPAVEPLEPRRLLAFDLQALGPVGSLMYESRDNGEISAADEVDAFTIDVDPRQTITVVAETESSLDLALTLKGPGGATVDSADDAAAGADEVIQTFGPTEAGTYTIEVAGASQTTGDYTLQLVLNAAVEMEGHTGVPNDTAGGAQDLDDSFIDLDSVPGGAERGAVVRSSEVDASTLIDGFESGDFSALDWNTSGDAFWFVTSADSRTGTYSAESGDIGDSQDSRLEVDQETGAGNIEFARYVSSEGSYDYLRFYIDGNQMGEWSGEVPWSTASYPVTAGLHTFAWEFSKDSSISHGLDGARIDDVSFPQPGPPSVDWYRFSLDDGQSATVVATPMTQGDLTLDLYDADENPLAASVPADNVGRAINNFVDQTADGAADTYLVRITGRESTDYSLVIGRDADFDTEPNDDASPDAQTLSPISTAFGALQAGAPPITEETEPNDDGVTGGSLADLALANDWSGSFEPVGGNDYEATLTGTISAGADVDWDFFKIFASPGDSIYLAMDGVSLGDTYLRLYDNTGTQIADNDDGSGLNSRLNYSSFSYAGDYYVVADSYGGNTGTYILTGTLTTTNLTGVSNNDYFSIEVVENDTLTIETSTPGDGLHEFENVLDPVLTLFDPAGAEVATDDDGAGDNRNAKIIVTAGMTGTYTVRVSQAAEDEGEYVLRASGQTGGPPAFEVISTSPDDGALFAVAPAQIRMDFNDSVLIGSLTPSSVQVDGVSITGWTVVDGDTVVFDLPANGLAEGPHNVAVAGGAILDLQGTDISAFSSEYTVDTIAPRVVQTSILHGDVLPDVTIQYTAGFDEPLDGSTLTGADVTLQGEIGGGHAPGSFVYSATPSEVTLDYDGLGDDRYTLTLHSGDGRFEDLVGHNLDGERHDTTTVPSGDGSAGGDFAIEFLVDTDELPFPVPLRAVAPPGSLIYQGQTAGFISMAGDTDRYTINVDAGQTITVVAETDPAVDVILTLQDPSGTTIDSVDDAGPGVGEVLQTAGPTADDTYTIEITGKGTAVGRYDLRLVLNAALESEPFGVPNNNSGAAQILGGDAFIPLGNGAANRAGVLGTFTPTPREAEDFETGALGVQWATYSSDGNGRIRVTGTPAPAEGQYALLMDRTGTGYTLNEAIWTVDLSRVDQATLSFWHAEWDDEVTAFDGPFVDHYDADGLAISDDGENWHPIWDGPNQTDGVWEPYEIDLAAEAEAAGITLGSGFQIKFQQYDNHELTGDGRGFDAITILSADEDWYQFTLGDGQSASLALASQPAGVATLEIYDVDENLLAAGVTAANAGQVIQNFVDSTTDGSPDSYFAQVSVNDGAQYNLVVTLGAAFETERNNAPDDAHDISGLGGVLGRSILSPGGTTLLSDFAGMDADDTLCGCEPPDTHAAAGPDHVIEVINTAIAIYDKDGKELLRQELDQFFTPLNPGTFVFDPVVAYDEMADRWIVGALDGRLNLNEADFLYAISDTSDPMEGFSEMQRFVFTPGLFTDYPKVGWNADAHVFSFNMFTGYSFERVDLLVVDKSTVLDEDPDTVAFNIINRSAADFTMAVATMHDSQPGDPMWFVEQAGFGVGSEVRVVRMDNVLGGAPLFTEFDLPVTPYSSPPNAAQPGGTFEANDARMLNAEWRDNRLYATQTVGLGGEATVRWYEFDTETGVPVLTQEGDVDPGPGVHTFFPSIAVNTEGDVGLTYMQSSSTEFVSMYAVGRTADDPPGTMRDPALVHAGEVTYTGSRGGDYSGITVDPVTDSFWAANEVILGDSRWSTWIGEFRLSAIGDDDWYEFQAADGNPLVIEAFTPADGTGEFVNPIDVGLELFAPSDPAAPVATATIPHDPRIEHTAGESGAYRLRVFGEEETFGDYFVSLEGAVGQHPAPFVIDADPDDGSQVNQFPVTYTLDFSESILITTVQPGDLIVGGLPATDVTVIDGDTFEFTLDPATNIGDGMYTVSLAADAVRDLQGMGNLDFDAAFEFDSTGPRIVGTSWNGSPFPADGALPATPLTFQATFDEGLRLSVSAAKGLRSPGNSDVLLQRHLDGAILNPDSVSIDGLNFTANFDDPLEEGTYTLTLVSGPGAFEDEVGNSLDGEPLGGGTDGTPTGDGDAGGDYTVDFLVDTTTRPAVPFRRLDPAGSLVFVSQNNGLIHDSADMDDFRVFLEGGQSIAAVATPLDPDALLSLHILGLTDAELSPAAGEPVVLAPPPTTDDGTWTVRVGGSRLTNFTLTIYRNAAVEASVGDTEPGNELAIDASKVDLGAGRYAVVGTSHSELSLGAGGDDFETGDFSALDWTTSGNADWFVTNLDSNNGTYSAESGDIGNSQSSRLQVVQDTGAGDIEFARYVSSEGDYDYLRFYIDGNEMGSWSGTVPWGTVTYPVDAGLHTFAWEYTKDGSFSEGLDGARIDDVVFPVTVPTEPDVDRYTIHLSDADGPIDVVLAGIDDADFSNEVLELLDADGSTVLHTAGPAPGGSEPPNFDLGLFGVDVPAEGDYTLRVTSLTPGDYSIVVTQSLILETEPNDAIADPLRTLDVVETVVGHVSAEFLLLYDDRELFDADYPGLPIEDFEEALVDPGDLAVCMGPLENGAANACFGADDILPGIRIEADGPGHPAEEMVVLGADYIGNPSIVVGPNSFNENTLISFPDGDVFAVGLDILIDDPGAVNVTVFGEGDEVLAATSVNASSTGTFFGIAASDAIFRILVESEHGDLVDNVAFGPLSGGLAPTAGMLPTDPRVARSVATLSPPGDVDSFAALALAREKPHDSLPRFYLPDQQHLFRYDGLLSAPEPGADPLDVALDYLNQHAADLGLATSDLIDATVTNQYVSSHTGITHVYLRQTYNELEVANTSINVNVTAAGEVINVGSSFVPELGPGGKTTVAEPTLGAGDALAELADYFSWTIDVAPEPLYPPKGPSQSQVLSPSGVSFDKIPARLQYVPTHDGGVELAWQLIVRTVDGEHWYDANVSALDGDVLYVSDWVDYAAYNVLPQPVESPSHGNRSLLSDPHDTAASPFGWHDTDGAAGAEHTDTRGNNVFAQEDRDSNNSGGHRPDGGASLDFDFDLNLNQDPVQYEDAAITNLFYWNNILHDVHFQYGFNEAAGNFQETNYGPDGLGGDAVQADAQDGSGYGNANFYTPPDGQVPRMQQYIFTETTPNRDSDLDNGIIVHEYGHGVSNRLTGGPANADALDAVQSGGMGEGWSDWWTLMFTQEPGDAATDAYPVGTYVLGKQPDGEGIRRYSYSFDMNIDPLTFGIYNQSSQVHDAGEIWASALWDLNWLLIDGNVLEPGLPPGLGFDPDLYHGTGGNNLALQLVMDALKLQPANPSFLDGRDAILAADEVLTGGDNSVAIWTAFARRGMGYSADDGGGASATIVTEAFDLPANSRGVVDFDRRLYGVGDTVGIQVRDLDLLDSGGATVSVATSGGDLETVTLGELGSGVFEGDIATAAGAATPGNGSLELSVGERITVTYNDVDDGTGSPAVATDEAIIVTLVDVFNADFSDAAGDPYDEGFTLAGATSQWHLSTGRGGNPGHTSDDSFYFGSGEGPSGGGMYGNSVQGTVTSPLVDLSGYLGAELSFRHFLATESGYDFATVSVLGESGETVLARSGQQLPTFTNGFRTVSFDISEFFGQQIRVRFEFSSDSSVTYEGWYVDDVIVRGADTRAEVKGPTVVSIDPPEGLAVNTTVSELTVEFSEPVSVGTAEDPANYRLIEAGPNGVFDDGAGDDIVIPVVPTLEAGQTVATLAVDAASAPLAAGNYQLTIEGDSSIEDLDGNPLNSITGPGGGRDAVHEFEVVFQVERFGDLYEFDMLEGQQVRFTAQAVFGEPGGVLEPNDLDAMLIVYDRMEITLARDDNSLDGLNPQLDFVAPADGSYLVQVIAENGAGEYVFDLNRGPFVDDTLQVTSLSPTDSGFEIEFNRQLDPSGLTLYEADGQFGPADVTLTGDVVGPVAGSLLIDPGLRKVTFIKTGSILEADTYSVALRSGADAFQDWQGEPLDGDGDGTGTPGDHYDDSFVVAAPGGITVGLPDFTRGPEQPVNLPPSQLDAGIPLSLSQGFRVDRVELELHYDPALLEISGFTLDSNVAARGGQVVLTPLIPGAVGLTITAPTGLSGVQGAIIAGVFTASVPADAAYGAAHILDIANLTVSVAGIGNVPSIDDDALHMAAYFGDATGNEEYSGLDAQRVARVAVNLDTGFDAFPQVDPVVIADVTVNGEISGLDAQRIAQEAVGLDPDEIPPITGPARQATSSMPTGALSFAPSIPGRLMNVCCESRRAAESAPLSPSLIILPPQIEVETPRDVDPVPEGRPNTLARVGGGEASHAKAAGGGLSAAKETPERADFGAGESRAQVHRGFVPAPLLSRTPLHIPLLTHDQLVSGLPEDVPTASGRERGDPLDEEEFGELLGDLVKTWGSWKETSLDAGPVDALFGGF